LIVLPRSGDRFAKTIRLPAIQNAYGRNAFLSTSNRLLNWQRRFRHPRNTGSIARTKLNELVKHSRGRTSTLSSNAARPCRRAPLLPQSAVVSKSYRRRTSTLSAWTPSRYLSLAVAQSLVSNNRLVCDFDNPRNYQVWTHTVHLSRCILKFVYKLLNFITRITFTTRCNRDSCGISFECASRLIGHERREGRTAVSNFSYPRSINNTSSFTKMVFWCKISACSECNALYDLSVLLLFIPHFILIIFILQGYESRI